MMYTLIINDDNTVVATQRQRIMEKSKLVDVLRFIVPKVYNGWELKNSQLIMQYKSPISNTVRIETLVLSDDNYKEEYLLYTLPIDTDITAERGSVSCTLEFVESIMDELGEVTDHVRNTDSFVLNIIPVESWLTVPDDALQTLTQIILENQKAIRALADLNSSVNTNKADNWEIDTESGNIYLKSNGQRIGTPISINDLGDAIAELTQKGVVKVTT